MANSARVIRARLLKNVNTGENPRKIKKPETFSSFRLFYHYIVPVSETFLQRLRMNRIKTFKQTN